MSSWLLSTTCSNPFDSISSATSTFEKVQEWIAYILFSECPQHSIATVINVVFFFHWLLSCTICRPAIGFPTKHIWASGASRSSWRFLLTLSSAFALAAISIAITILFAWPSLINANPWSSTSMIRETVFSGIEAFSWIAAIAILMKEKKLCSLIHPLALRTWWFTSFLVMILLLTSSIVRLSEASGFTYDLLLEIVDTIALVKFLVLAFIFWVAIDGHTGLVIEPDSVKDPLLADNDKYGADSVRDPLLADNNDKYAAKSMNGKEQNAESRESANGVTSGFASASIFSKAAFTWLTPLIMAGSKRTLQIGDVPGLGPRDRAENMHDFLRSKWPQDPRHLHPLRTALIQCFWPQFLLTGFFQVIRTAAIYVGPLLINSFSSYASGDHSSVFDGYVLVILLLTAKLVELFAYHQYNFHCYRMGNNVRTAVMTALYRKSLRLSSSARQEHGVGQITNYMVVDAQQLSDACLQLHVCWSMPLQVIIALVLLYQVIGTPAIAGIAAMIVITFTSLWITRRQKRFQGLLMQSRDRRMKAIAEILAYMKIIKLQAWEEKFEEKVVSDRKAEFNRLSQFVYSTAANRFTLWSLLPTVSVLTYMTAVLLDTGLTTAKVFTATSVFSIVQQPIWNFPQAAFALAQLVTSLERLDAYMRSSELEEGAIEKVMDMVGEEYPVTVHGGFFAWKESQAMPTLHDINLDIKRGSLVTIVGKVGSGKSSLLAALLGEMLKVSGTARTAGSIAYVSQTAWIQNATIKENILFGLDAVEEKYKEVVHACGLEPDFASLNYGDETEIGEKGINLSGGQKQRVQLARAIYQDSDVYLLDDIFSAVDAHTGSHLFKKCIRGLLKEKTILLVTHQVEFLSRADLVVVMKEGKMVQSGTYHEILNAGTDFADLVAAHNQSMDMVDREEYWVLDQNGSEAGCLIANNEDTGRKQGANMVSMERGLCTLSSSGLSSSHLSMSDSFSSESKALKASSKLIEDEKRETGHVSWSVYWLYLTKAFGWKIVVVLLINQCLWQASLLGSNYWLADEIPKSSGETVNNKTRFILVYVLLNVTSMLGLLARVLLTSTFGLRTAQVFFHGMLHSIFRAPMSFFDTTPSGRILSRFSADQTNLDFLLHFFMGASFGVYFSTLGSLIVISISAWPILLLIVPLSLVYYWYQKLFLTSSREITRLDSITKAPVIYHFSETVTGLETIRCFRKQEAFAQKSLDRVNTNMTMDFHNNTANEWLGLRLEAIGTAILCTTAFLFVVLPSNLINSDTVALALSYALGLNSSLFYSVFVSCNVENKMVSVERIWQYTILPKEAVCSICNCLPSLDWPTRGQIVSKRLKLRYRPTTPLVLKGVNFTIEGGENVGVVGRTGSGKSTLILALFRLVEPVSGQIWIDNVDISTIGLHDLRKRLGIIPQDPVLFEGTIRTNLDPCNVYSDDEIWQALQKCQLGNIIKENPGKLETSVTEAGSNWSVGQRQLLCFGRALLKHSKILFLDEATASVDTQTDVVIQAIIREEFKESTVVSIAHRIPTVIDSDKVIVMEAGLVKEFDSPSNLLQKPNSVFASLVHEYSSRAGR